MDKATRYQLIKHKDVLNGAGFQPAPTVLTVMFTDVFFPAFDCLWLCILGAKWQG